MKNEDSIMENYVKQELRLQIDRLSDLPTNFIINFEDDKKIFNLDIPRIPNISITLNNKIIELQHEFERKGISLYITHFKNKGAYYDGTVGISLLGSSIINDLFSIYIDSIKCLQNYSKTSISMLEEKNLKLVEFKKAGPIKKLFRIFNKLFSSKDEKIFDYSPDDLNKLKHYLQQYKSIDNDLYNYSLKDRIIPSLIVRLQEYNPEQIPSILDEAYFSDLEKLGFAYLIPQIKEKIEKEFNKDLFDKNSLNNKVSNSNEDKKKDTISQEQLDNLIEKKEAFISNSKILSDKQQDLDR